MTTVYTTPTAFGTIVALYTCPCGRQATRVGLSIRSVPRGWVETSLGQDEHLCPECARYASEALAQTK
jgi:hypothetical protein